MKRGRAVAAVILATLVATGVAWAATDAFLKIDGVPGESQDAKHHDEIELLGWSWSVKMPASSYSGGGGAVGRPQFSDMTIQKLVDKASPTLFLSAATGDHLTKAVLTVRKSGGEQFEFLKFTLSDMLVTSVAEGGVSNSDTLPSEEISLSYGKILMEYRTQNPDGSPGAWIPKTFDLIENKGI